VNDTGRLDLAVVWPLGCFFSAYAKGPLLQPAVFWSGGITAQEAAIAHASAIGGATLDMLPVGQLVDNLSEGLAWNNAVAYWNQASRGFACSASGDISVIHGYQGVRTQSVWAQIE
jgi:hypothetical protein